MLKTMEVTSNKVKRLFRSEAQIKGLLAQQGTSGLSINAFCKANGLGQASFHNWQKKYRQQKPSPGFAAVNISSSGLPVLFAEVSGIKLYQPVSAAYLKELLS